MMPTEVSTATDESTNEDHSRDRGSLVEVTVVVFADGPRRLSLRSPKCIFLGSAVVC